MTEVSAVGDRALEGTFDIREPSQEEQVLSSPETPSILSPQESMERLKASENLHKALAPHLTLDIEDPNKTFARNVELFKSKLKTFQGGSFTLQGFAQQLRELLLQVSSPLLIDQKLPNVNNFMDRKEFLQKFIEQRYNTILPVLSDKNRDLQTELAIIYIDMLYSAEKSMYLNNGFSCGSPLTQLFELEQETGYIVIDFRLVHQAMILHAILSGALIEKAISSSFQPPDELALKQLVEGQSIIEMKKILDLCEKQGDLDGIETAIYIALIDIALNIGFSVVYKQITVQEQLNNLAPLLPYVIKHHSLEVLDDYFKGPFSRLSAWDRAYHWIDLHCQAAEILATSNPQKSAEHLAKAEKMRDQELWSLPLSFNKSAIANRRQEANIRIEKAREVIQNNPNTLPS